MDFGAVISRALRITWNYRVLWILGFLAALGSGVDLNQGVNQGVRYSFSGSELPPGIRNLLENPAVIGAMISGALALVCVLFLIAIALLVINIIARGGLIGGVQQIEVEGDTTFERAWSAGAARFWRLLGLDILIWLPFILVLIILIALFGGSILAAVSTSSGPGGQISNASGGLIAGGIVVFCCGLCLLILYGIVAQAIQVFGERAIVIENRGVTDSISRAWAIFRANLGNIILLALLMFVISIIFGLITSAIVAALVLAGAGLAFIQMFQGALQPGAAIQAVVSFVVALVLASIINALYVVFNSTTWTLAFRQFTGAAPATTAPVVVPPPLPTP